MTIAASLLLLLLMTIAASLLTAVCSSAINRVGSVEEVMDGEDGNRLRSSYASNLSCTFLFIVISSGPVLLTVLVTTAAFSLSSSYKENAPSSTSSSDTL